MNSGSDNSSSERIATEPVVIEGQTVDDGMPDTSVVPIPTTAVPAAEPAPASPSTAEAPATTVEDAPAAPATSAQVEPGDTTPDEPQGMAEISEILTLLTSLLVGAAIEGSNELLGRLREYEAELKALAASEAETAPEDEAAGVQGSGEPETAFDTLRYMLVGLVFDAQRSVGHGLGLAARATDSYLTMAVKASRPLTHNALTRPFQSRIDRLAARGQTRVARWIEDGRAVEPTSRALARMTYSEIIDDFINHLAENPEVQALVTKQSLGLASEVRDEVRERTVTADNVVESLVRRILRREPRASLPEPDPIVQEWATRGLRTSTPPQQEDK